MSKKTNVKLKTVTAEAKPPEAQQVQDYLWLAETKMDLSRLAITCEGVSEVLAQNNSEINIFAAECVLRKMTEDLQRLFNSVSRVIKNLEPKFNANLDSLMKNSGNGGGSAK